jgi:signal transduction histidine kinase
MRINPKKLATKLGAILALVGLLSFAAITLIISSMVSSQFSAIEKTDVEASISRANAMLSNLRQVMASKAADYAIWDDAYEYLSDGNPAFVDANISFDSLNSYDVNGIGFVRFDKSRTDVFYYDREAGEIDAELTSQLTAFVQSDVVLAKAKAEEQFSSYVRLGGKIAAIGIVQSRRSDRSGELLGFVVVARELEQAQVRDALQVEAGYDFEVSKDPGFVIADANRIDIRVNIAAIDDKPVGALTYHVPRSLLAAGQRLQIAMIIGIALLIGAMLLVLNLVLAKTVVRPLRGVERHVGNLGQSGDLVAMPHDGRRDEIGSLEAGFNAMVAQLRDLRAQLEAQSFLLGKNQNAIGNMHNVRNGLSPVSTLLSLLSQQLNFPSRGDVGKALTELGSDETPRERRQLLADFASAAIKRVADQLEAGREKASEAERSLSHVVDAITQEQTPGAEIGTQSVCDLTAVVSASASIATYNKHGAKVEVDYADERMHLVSGNRVLIAQVVGNLITNAVEAIVATGRGDGCIRVRSDATEVDGRAMVRVTITDNGDGFDAESAGQLFGRGFSKRSHKKGGLGLHWCANTINAMGGTLTLDSDGPGKGATATLTLARALPVEMSG